MSETTVPTSPLSPPTTEPVHRRMPAALRPDIRATPAVRMMARELGVDLTRIAGTGVGGSITRGDVAAAAEPAAPAHAPDPMPEAAAVTAVAALFDEADVGDWPDGTDPATRLDRALRVASAAEPALAGVAVASSGTEAHPGVTLVGGGRHVVLPVGPPQVAVLAAGPIRDGVVAMRGVAVATQLLPLSLSIDPAAVTVEAAACFLAAVVADLHLAE